MKKLALISGSLACLLALSACGNDKKSEDPVSVDKPPKFETLPVEEVTSGPVVVFSSLKAEDWWTNEEGSLSDSETGTLMVNLSDGQSIAIIAKGLDIPAGEEVTSEFDITVSEPLTVQVRMHDYCETGNENTFINRRKDLEAGANTITLTHAFDYDVQCIRTFIRPSESAMTAEITGVSLSH